MNADILAGLEFYEREKGISRDVLVGAVQEALLSAAKKAVGPARELRVEMDHSRETFASMLQVCERVAAEKFAPANRRVDTQEPRMEGERVVLPDCAYETARAYVETGLLAATQDYAFGGMQLPTVVETAANAFFAKGGIGLGGGGLLTVGNANLLLAHGTERQRDVFARHELSGRWSGTMCLSEPQAGSGLSDIITRAVPDGVDHQSDPLGPRFRLIGSKMWISNGDHKGCFY